MSQVKVQAPGVTKPTVFQILGVKVMFVSTEVGFTVSEKLINTDLSVVTIASATAKDVNVEDVEITDIKSIFIVNENHETIMFQLYVSNLKELIFEASKIYVEILKGSHSKILKGFEFTYFSEVNFYKDNMISLVAIKKQLDNV